MIIISYLENIFLIILIYNWNEIIYLFVYKVKYIFLDDVYERKIIKKNIF